jgi:Ca2+-binding EF-hand superfamily protein
MKFSRWLLMGTMVLSPLAIFAQSPPSPAEMESERAALFAQADADGSGTLSLSEFKTFESLMRDKMTEHHFNHLDTKGDGAVSLDQLQADHPGPGFGHPPF